MTLVKPLSVLAFTFVLFQVLIRPDMTRERENLTKANLKADTAQFSSVQFSHSIVSDSLQPHGLQHTRLPCGSPLLELAKTHVH